MNKLKFYINQVSIVENLNNIDLSFIPPLLKRKLSDLNRFVFYAIEQCYSQNIGTLIYSSQYGEFDKLLKIIEQYNEYNEVSPIVFSSSVHNASPGTFNIFKKNAIPYMALSARNNTISMSLLYAAIQPHNSAILCYADYINEKPICVAIAISKDDIGGQQCVLTTGNSEIECKNSEYNQYISFLKGDSDKLNFSNFKVERVLNVK